jgi:hypothetical protein
MVAVRLPWGRYHFLNHNTALLVPHNLTSPPLKQRRIYPYAHISMSVRARTVIPHPLDHLLIAAVCMPRVARILAAATTLTRNLESNPIQEEDTLPQICNPMIGTAPNTKNAIFGQKVPGTLMSALTVSDLRDFVLALLLSSS